MGYPGGACAILEDRGGTGLGHSKSLDELGRMQHCEGPEEGALGRLGGGPTPQLSSEGRRWGEWLGRAGPGAQ